MIKKISILVLLLFFISGCSRMTEIKRQGFYIDNVFEVKLKYKKDKDIQERAENSLANAFNNLIQLDTSFNKFSNLSEIVALNSMAGIKKVEVTPETYSLISKSIAASIITEGYFDITWEPLMKIFSGGRQPGLGEINTAKAAIGYLNIQLDRGLNRIKFSNGNTKINIDRIKRGYAIDNLVQNISRRELKNGYIKTGNIAYYFGPKNEKIKLPNRKEMKVNVSNKAIIILNADDEFIKESANWRPYLSVETSPNILEKVIVVAPNALTAEVLANAFYFMGPDKSMQLINTLKAKANDQSLYNAILVASENATIKVYTSLNKKRK